MHPKLMCIPNELVYDNQIRSMYRGDIAPIFMCEHAPILFVNCEESEGDFGTSYFNREESLIIKKLFKYFTNSITPPLNNCKNYGFVSPYQGQVSILKQDLKEYGQAVVENVRTIDAWQGREKGVIFFSAVRSNP